VRTITSEIGDCRDRSDTEGRGNGGNRRRILIGTLRGWKDSKIAEKEKHNGEMREKGLTGPASEVREERDVPRKTIWGSGACYEKNGGTKNVYKALTERRSEGVGN